jgi:RHS repeat-associated protein
VEYQALPFAEPMTGLVYARARWYDPSTGSFLSPDPRGYIDSSNLYSFAGGDPVNGRDPRGEQARPAPRPPMRPVVRPPAPGQRGPVITAPRTPTPYAPGDWSAFRSEVEIAKATRPRSAGARVLGGLTADELTPGRQQQAIERMRCMRDPACAAEGIAIEQQIGLIALGSPELPYESLPALGGAGGGGDDGGDDEGVCWNNGWRTSDGKFASPCGAGRSGEEAEESVWDAVAQKPGWRIVRGRVYVRDPDGVVRVYDGVAISPRGRAIGLEVKSGNARRTASQREFDRRLNSEPANTAVPVGQHRDVVPPVKRAIEIRKQ